jgi:large subunit ribosomal protein L5e
MTFIKVQKNNAYFKRFQVKFRRRREGKTDYYQRKRLIYQRKNKYSTPKWRFVVRRTNQRVICQVVRSTLRGDIVRTSADSYELRRFGLTAGLTNYSAAYCTGLLCARRLLRQLDADNKAKKIDSKYADTFNMVAEATGEFFDFEQAAQKKNIEIRPFTCFLDLGLASATVGNRVFGALKGAVDGGLNIPHSDKIFPKVKEDKGAKKDAKANPHRDRIYGNHVQIYIDLIKKDEKRFQLQFANWSKNLQAAKVAKVEELIKKVHAEIKKNPDRPAKKERKQAKTEYEDKARTIVKNAKKPYRRDRKLTNQQRKQRVQEKIKKFAADRQKGK